MLKHKRRAVGPAMEAIQNRMKTQRTPGICMIRECRNKSTTPKAKWCKKHQKEVRKLQNAANHTVWKMRVAAGMAGHHVVYKGRPTSWAATNKRRALRLAQAGHSVHSPDRLRQILSRMTPSRYAF